MCLPRICISHVYPYVSIYILNEPADMFTQAQEMRPGTDLSAYLPYYSTYSPSTISAVKSITPAKIKTYSSA